MHPTDDIFTMGLNIDNHDCFFKVSLVPEWRVLLLDDVLTLKSPGKCGSEDTEPPPPTMLVQAPNLKFRPLTLP
jgi:hypothetical protein